LSNKVGGSELEQFGVTEFSANGRFCQLSSLGKESLTKICNEFAKKLAKEKEHGKEGNKDTSR
jgi:hypothetical protein